MKIVWIIASKEIQDRIRNRWILTMTLLMAGLAMGLVFLGSSPSGTVGASPLAVTIVSLSSLSIFLIPLIALLLSHDAIVGELESGTLLLLLTYPVSRWHILLGKFLGHGMVIAFTTIVGYGTAGLAILLMDTPLDGSTWMAFFSLLLTSVLLGWVFVSIALWMSLLVRERATAAALAIGIWFFFVILFDFLLLGILVEKSDWIDAQTFPLLLLLNPTDIFRLFNLSGFENVRAFSGMIGLSDTKGLSQLSLLIALVTWILIPLGLAGLMGTQKEIE